MTPIISIQNVDPDDVQLMELLEGMAVEKNGKVSQVRVGLCRFLSGAWKGIGFHKELFKQRHVDIREVNTACSLFFVAA